METQAQEAAIQNAALALQLERAAEGREQALAEARQCETRMRQAQELAARENERLQHNLSNASAQLTVLMDTIETLEGAKTSEQLVANLTTKLTLAAGVELQLQLCNSQLHHELQDRLWQCGQLEAQVAKLQEQPSKLTHKLAAAQQQQQLDARELHPLKAELVEREQLLAQAHAVQQQQQQHTQQLEDEAGCLKRALEEQRARHAAHVKELCAEPEADSEGRLRERDLSAHWLEQVGAVERELVEFAVEKLLVRQRGGRQQQQQQQQQEQQQQQGADAAGGTRADTGLGVCVAEAGVASEVRERMAAAIADMSAQVQELVRSKLAMQWEQSVKERKIAGLEAALDASLSLQSLAQSRCLALQQRVRLQACAEDGHAWSRVEALEHRARVLSQHLEATNERSIKLGAALAQAQHDRDAASAALAALQRRQLQVSADHEAALLEHTRTLQEQALSRAAQLEQSLRDFISKEVLQLLSTQEQGEQAQLVALSEELCRQQTKQAVLHETLATMQQRQDVQRRQLTASKEALARAEARLAETTEALLPLRSSLSLPDSVASVEELVQARECSLAASALLAADLQVERANLVRAREETLLQVLP